MMYGLGRYFFGHGLITDYCDDEQGVRMKSKGSIQDTTRLVAKGVTVALAASLLASCGSVQRAYWDAKVEEMCRKDGGVTVYERVKISRDDYKRFGGTGGTILVPRRQIAAPDAPYVAENKTTSLNENPEVYRSETSIVRRSDGKVLSRLVHYARVGGEIFRPYGCREVGIRMDIEQQTFEVTGE